MALQMMACTIVVDGVYHETMERPNTISGLQAKRAELIKLHENLVADAKKVMVDIDHLDATIRLFDPDADLSRRMKNRYAIKHRAHFGHSRRFVLNALRTSTAPMTSKAITYEWIKDRGLKPDEATRVILTKRIGACISGLRKDGHIEYAGMDGEYKTWRVKPDAPNGKHRSDV
ncbi:MAG: hypothetical protein Q8R02_22425 [Hyphomonadaceae bacterium]|nr:hypothetical protein [Hyphomonadaceae bacterium]